jgi:hypothetical protein
MKTFFLCCIACFVGYVGRGCTTSAANNIAAYDYYTDHQQYEVKPASRRMDRRIGR